MSNNSEERSSEQLTVQIPEELRDKLDAWQQEYGEIVVAPVMHAGSLLELVVCRPPKLGELDLVDDGKFDPNKSKAGLLRAFVKTCLLHPEQAAWEQLVTKKPGVAAAIAVQLRTVSGNDVQVVILGN
jgi:hypothetical protein